MRVPMELPLAPMLARMVAHVPDHDEVSAGYAYEPKWDGFRCLILRDGDQVELSSRLNRSLTRSFPEVVEQVRQALPPRCVVDAEIVVRVGPPGRQRLDWDALTQRIHPAAARVNPVAARQPAELICFDLLGVDDHNLMALAQRDRRARLEQVFTDIGPHSGVHLGAMTTDAELARHWFATFTGGGIDGVMIKDRGAPYEPGRRSWLKVKHQHTAEAVVLGYRQQTRSERVGSLLLGMYDERGRLVNVGTVESLSPTLRDRLRAELEPLVTEPDQYVALAVEGRRRLVDAETQVVALRPELVLEVGFDQLEGRRFRHAASFVRLRPDREPRSCTLDQVEQTAGYDLAEVLR